MDANLIATVKRLEIDGAERTVILEVRWAVDQGVLAPELLLNFAEASGHVLDADRVECLTTRGFGDDAEYLVALAFARTDISADGVDDSLGTLAHFDCVGRMKAAVVIVAIRDKDKDAADGPFAVNSEQLVVAGFLEGIEDCCAAAGPELLNTLFEQCHVVGEALRDVDLDVKALDKGQISAMKYLAQELDCRILLELKPLPDRTGGVDHDTDAEWEIGLLSEV
nr:beta-ketoacyl synthase active site-containing protein [uncultured bacterium]